MNRWDKFVVILIILAFLANQGIISPDAPEGFVKDELGLNFFEEVVTWSNNFNTEKPIAGIILLIWIIIKNFWMPAIIAVVYRYIKNTLEGE